MATSSGCPAGCRRSSTSRGVALRWRRLVAPLLGAALLLAVVPAVATATTATFSFTGAEQDFVVPATVSQLTIQAFGALGGQGSPVGGTSRSGTGGSVTATFAVTPGETLAVFVGSQGGTSTDGLSGGPGGFNGGGDGGAGALGPIAAGGGGGGGASDVRQGGSDLANRIIVAGGGAGGGGSYSSLFGGIGGDGGGLTGGTGGGAGGATGGSQIGGGHGGTGLPN